MPALMASTWVGVNGTAFLSKKGKQLIYYFSILNKYGKKNKERKMENNHLHSDVSLKTNKQKQTQCSGNAGFLLQV